MIRIENLYQISFVTKRRLCLNRRSPTIVERKVQKSKFMNSTIWFIFIILLVLETCLAVNSSKGIVDSTDTLELTSDDLDLLQRLVQDDNVDSPPFHNEISQMLPINSFFDPAFTVPNSITELQTAETYRSGIRTVGTGPSSNPTESFESQDFGSVNDIPARFQLKHIQDPRSKLDRLIDIDKALEQDGRSLTPGAIDFRQRGLRPIMNCLNHHFNGDCEKFIIHHNGRLPHTGFSKTQCTGKGDVCNLARDESQLNDLPERYHLSEISDPRMRLEKLLKIQQSLPALSLKAKLTHNAYVFVQFMMMPVLKCLQNHFDGDIDAFLQKHDLRVSYSNFRVEHCCGRGDKCNISDRTIPREDRSDLDERHALKSIAPDKERLRAMVELESKLPFGLKQYKSGARDFITGQLRPVVNCLENHHNGDIDAFMNYWKSYEPIAQFKRFRCCGRGSECHTESKIPHKRPRSVESDA